MAADISRRVGVGVSPVAARPGPVRTGWTAGRIVALVAGSIMILFSVVLLGGAGVLAWADQEAEDLLGRQRTRWHYRGHGRLADRERTRLVEHHRGAPGQPFQHAAAFDHHSAPRRGGQPGSTSPGATSSTSPIAMSSRETVSSDPPR
jgi:hypothetical protein